MASSAARPSCASPSINSKAYGARSLRSRERAEASSSAIKALMGMQRYYDLDQGPTTRALADEKFRSVSVQRAQAFLYVTQPHAGAQLRAQAHTIVFNAQVESFAFDVRLHAHAAAFATRREPVTDRILE